MVMMMMSDRCVDGDDDDGECNVVNIEMMIMIMSDKYIDNDDDEIDVQ